MILIGQYLFENVLMTSIVFREMPQCKMSKMKKRDKCWHRFGALGTSTTGETVT